MKISLLALMALFFSATGAQASVVGSLVKAQINLGLVDQSTVVHNYRVYNQMVNAAKNNSNNRYYVVALMSDLSKRLKNQLGFLGQAVTLIYGDQLDQETAKVIHIAKNGSQKELISALNRVSSEINSSYQEIF